MNKIACIDIGTNSVLLSIAQKHNNWLNEIIALERVTQLGKDVSTDNILHKNSIDKTIRAIEEYITIAKKHTVNKIIAVGTAAMRNAKNSNYIIETIQKKYGITIEIISGTEESRLSYVAATQSLPHIHNTCIVDIGGGSVEFATDKNTKSIDMGCVNLSQTFTYPKNIDAISSTISSTIIKDKKLSNKNNFIAIGGTPTTLAMIALQLKTYDATKVHGFTLTKIWIKNFKNTYIQSLQKYNEYSYSGISPKRLHILGYGIEILLSIMQTYNVQNVTVSDAGMRHAIIWEYLKNE